MSSSAIAPQVKWEYHSLTRVSEAAMVESLNQLGQESWELVSASHYRDMQGMMAWTAILKRPIGDGTGTAVHRQVASAPMATPPAAKQARADDEMEFEVATPSPRPPRPHSASKPAKPRVELSDDFDFELADAAPTVQHSNRPTKVKAKPAGVEDELDFELGETFPTALKPSAPAAAKPKAVVEGPDDTDFDLG